jgi:hypothetical protein
MIGSWTWLTEHFDMIRSEFKLTDKSEEYSVLY